LSQAFFFLTAIGALVGAGGVVLLRNPFYGVLSLAFHLVCLAGLFLLLRAEFVAFVQVVVYAGAVMVLYVFVVAYVGGGQSLPSGAVLRVLGPLFAAGLAAELCIAMLGSALSGIKGKGAPYIPGFGTPAHIGKLFLTTYLFPFEAASILLLVAAVGAVVLARRRRGLEEPEEPPIRVRAPRPLSTGTMAEAAGVRPADQGEPLLPEVDAARGQGQTTTQRGW
jgi:NADH:ubiquinone oxidoreductase subunit 6 (subunit J)